MSWLEISSQGSRLLRGKADSNSRNHIVERYIQLRLAEYRRIFRSTDEVSFQLRSMPPRLTLLYRQANSITFPVATHGSDGSSSTTTTKTLPFSRLPGRSLDSLLPHSPNAPEEI